MCVCVGGGAVPISQYKAHNRVIFGLRSWINSRNNEWYRDALWMFAYMYHFPKILRFWLNRCTLQDIPNLCTKCYFPQIKRNIIINKRQLNFKALASHKKPRNTYWFFLFISFLISRFSNDRREWQLRNTINYILKCIKCP